MRYREVDPDVGIALGGEDGREQADQPAFGIDERTAGAAGIGGSVGLNEVLNRIETGVTDIARGDNAASYRQPEAVGVTDGADGLSQGWSRRRRQRGQVGFHPQQCDIAGPVLPDQLSRQDASVGQAHFDPFGRFDHVPSRGDQPARCHHDTAAFWGAAGRGALPTLGVARPDRQDRNDGLQSLRRDRLGWCRPQRQGKDSGGCACRASHRGISPSVSSASVSTCSPGAGVSSVGMR